MMSTSQINLTTAVEGKKNTRQEGSFRVLQITVLLIEVVLVLR